MEQSQLLASQANQINTLQTKKLEQCETNVDKSRQHLKNVEKDIEELQYSFCIRFCCSSKSKKSKSTDLSFDKSLENKSNKNLIELEQNPIYSDSHLQNLDKNLQRLQHFNTLIDHEMQQQLQTLVCFF